MTRETAPRGTLDLQPAGFVTRFVAFFIDQFIVTGVYAIVMLTIAILFQSFRLSELLGIDDLAQQIILIPLGASGILLNLVYYVGFWTLAGQTPGKVILGLTIVWADGSPLRLWPAVVRWVGYWLSGILFLGYLWILVDDRRQAWHDKLARTMVVYQVAGVPRMAPGDLRVRLQALGGTDVGDGTA